MLPAFGQIGVVLAHLDELPEVLESEVGKRRNADFADAVGASGAVLGLHLFAMFQSQGV